MIQKIMGENELLEKIEEARKNLITLWENKKKTDIEVLKAAYEVDELLNKLHEKKNIKSRRF